MKQIILSKKAAVVSGIVVGVVLAVVVSGAIWLYRSDDVLGHPLANVSFWPIACTTRGCVSVGQLKHQVGLDQSFASLLEVESPTVASSFTTVVRRHVVEHAFLRSPVTLADARRYREEVLHISEAGSLPDTLTSLEEYDELVILPFLQQEALREQHSTESMEELYGQLANDRRVWVFPIAYSWESERGAIVKN